jgi:surface protein
VLSWGPLKLGNKAFNFFGCPRLTLDTVIDVLDLTGVTNLTRIFSACQNLVTINNVELWDTSLIEIFDAAFEKCQLFDDNLSDWDISSTTSLIGMFRGCGSFNNDGSSLLNTQWDVSNVTDMSYMFQNCDVFDQPLGSWDVSLVEYMKYMFDGSYDFNQNISSWNVQNVLEMSGMFRNAIHFEQNIGSWNIQNVTDMSYMFANIQLSNTNYNALLNGWAAQPVQPDVIFDGGNSQYTISIAGAARTTLTSGPNNWIITDGGGV